jgi:hypothetical protein
MPPTVYRFSSAPAPIQRQLLSELLAGPIPQFGKSLLGTETGWRAGFPGSASHYENPRIDASNLSRRLAWEMWMETSRRDFRGCCQDRPPPRLAREDGWP